MDKYVVKYYVAGGSSGDKVVEVGSAFEAERQVRQLVAYQNKGREVIIREVRKK